MAEPDKSLGALERRVAADRLLDSARELETMDGDCDRWSVIHALDLAVVAMRDAAQLLKTTV